MMLRGFSQGEIGGQFFALPEQVLNVLIVLAIFALAYVIYRLVITRIIEGIVKRSGIETGVATFWKYIVLAITMLIAGVVSMPLVGGYTSATYFALGLVLGAIVLMLVLGSKDVLVNALSGYALMVYKPFKRGDMVVIDGKPGYVRDVTAVYTEIVREDGIYYIPNSELMKRPFIMRPVDAMSRLAIAVKVKSDADIDLAEQLIKDAVKQCKELVIPPEPEVYLTDINSQYSTLQVVVRVANPRRLPQARSRLLKMIRQAFINAGIQLF
ncbi:MAG: hypothetical protein DRJ60_03110 [Thermoprotei archaeon]|nr:MAG: hypothetical protein DRJ60_03110 [Thermoprotei archaeon]